MNLHPDNQPARVTESPVRIGPACASMPAAARTKLVPTARFVVLGAALLGAALGAASSFARGDGHAGLHEKAREVFPPLPKNAGTADYPITPERVRLGQMLFFDPRISDDGTMSCSRCHQPSLYATDALPRSIAVHGHPLPRNAQTILNASIHTTMHWDGRFANVEEQAKNSLVGPGFGNPDFPTAMARIKAIPGYAPMFRAAFPEEAEPINEANWGKAIGAYERTLIAPSRFDDYLSGKTEAISASERKGLQTFIETGCVECHKGPGVGGNGFRKFGVFADYRTQTGSSGADKGRFEVTNNPGDVDRFKIPGLRGVALTPPYFHDGAVNELAKAVRIMAKVQLDTDLAEADVNAIVDFLASLTGSPPEGFERPPLLPAGGFVNPPAHQPH